jgi:hypothetical protein
MRNEAKKRETRTRSQQHAGQGTNREAYKAATMANRATKKNETVAVDAGDGGPQVTLDQLEPDAC